MALASRQWLRNTTHSSLPDMAVHPSLADVLWSYDACAQLCCHNIMAPSSNAQAVNDCHARVGHNMASISFPRPAQSGLKEHVTQLVCLSMRQFGTREESACSRAWWNTGQASTHKCWNVRLTQAALHNSQLHRIIIFWRQATHKCQLGDGDDVWAHTARDRPWPSMVHTGALSPVGGTASAAMIRRHQIRDVGCAKRCPYFDKVLSAAKCAVHRPCQVSDLRCGQSIRVRCCVWSCGTTVRWFDHRRLTFF